MTHERSDEDVIALLTRQHAEIRELFQRLETTGGPERKDLFRRLVRLLAVHETAEEEIVHPNVRDLPDGETLVEARLGEEHRAKELLSTLDGLDPDDEGFDTLLTQLRQDVIAHAEHEEREEFPLLRRGFDAQRLHAMASTVRAAEAIAPTRPHPGVESARANLLLGPPMAVLDRARDALRSVLGR
ncbi:hemerythrin domain-containing protein [Prauserella oleivorans]|uniref:Hemerythrin domain-containing protein n=1 Tax=Prauserella oleivorans TaxID=1478153 RepID=A0ABW5WBF3_9PSEU